MATLSDLRDDDLAFDVVLRERTRLADALHDGALQEVVMLRHDCTDAIGGDLQALQPLQDGLLRMTTQLRALTSAMHEPSLNELSLREAIGRIVGALQTRGRLEIAVDVDRAADGYNDPVLRETVRELTTNVAQHANATMVAISIALEHDEIRVRVVDDGTGFDPVKAKTARTAGHIGLARLQRLADRLGGTFDMGPAVPVGTIATVRLPAATLRPGRTPVEVETPARSRPSARVLMLAADERDGVATSEDLVAAARDRAATLRDQPSARTPHSAAGLHGRDRAGMDLRAQQTAIGALEDRRHAAADRRRGASQRLLAAVDRSALAEQLVYAETDPLTGARTRSAGLGDLDREIDRSRRTAGVLVVTYLDVVGLKLVNDKDGHAAGDHLIQRVISTVRERLRPYDLVVRLGGDEFLCVMPDLPRVTAEQRFAGVTMSLAAPPAVAVRTGFAELTATDTSSTLVARADQDLLQRRNAANHRRPA